MPLLGLAAGKWPTAENWEPLDVQWSDPLVPVSDFTDFKGNAEFSTADHSDLAATMEPTVTLLPLADQGTGRAICAFKEHEQLVDWPKTSEGADLGEIDWVSQKANVTSWVFFEEQLRPNTFVYCRGLGAIAVEEESTLGVGTNPYSLRSYVKTNALTGIYFKRIWCSEEEIQYNRYWFSDAVENDEWD